MSNAPQRPRIPEIIHRPDLVTVSKKGTMALVAAIGWLIWLYLISPLTALLAWWFGYQRLNIFVLSDPVHTMQTLIIYSMVIAAGGAMFILWAVYNWLRFRDHDRRGAPAPATTAEIASAFTIPPQSVLNAQDGKILLFSFDDHGQITSIHHAMPLTTADPTSASPPQQANV